MIQSTYHKIFETNSCIIADIGWFTRFVYLFLGKKKLVDDSVNLPQDIWCKQLHYCGYRMIYAICISLFWGKGSWSMIRVYLSQYIWEKQLHYGGYRMIYAVSICLLGKREMGWWFKSIYHNISERNSWVMADIGWFMRFLYVFWGKGKWVGDSSLPITRYFTDTATWGRI